ncbi:hypothetical protein D3C86_2132860 [compost metagenome]
MSISFNLMLSLKVSRFAVSSTLRITMVLPVLLAAVGRVSVNGAPEASAKIVASFARAL